MFEIKSLRECACEERAKIRKARETWSDAARAAAAASRRARGRKSGYPSVLHNRQQSARTAFFAAGGKRTARRFADPSVVAKMHANTARAAGYASISGFGFDTTGMGVGRNSTGRRHGKAWQPKGSDYSRLLKQKISTSKLALKKRRPRP